MILNKKELEVLSAFLKPNNIVKFYNNDGNLSITYFGNSNYMKFELQKEWDFPINKFYFGLPNLNFVQNELLIQMDLDNVYLYLKERDFEIKLLLIRDNFYNDYKTDDMSYTKVSIDKIDNFISSLKLVSKTTDSGEVDFTSGIYLGQNGYFGTNKTTASWIKTSLSFKDIVIPLLFFNKLDKIENFDYNEFFILMESNKIGCNVIINDIKFEFLMPLLSVNYPDFNKIFSNFNYDCSILVNSEVLKDILSNLVKLNSKETILKLNFVDDYIILNTNNLDNTEFINVKIPIDYIKRNINCKINVNLLDFYRIISDLNDDLIIDYSSTQKFPLKVKPVKFDLNIERYVRILNA